MKRLWCTGKWFLATLLLSVLALVSCAPGANTPTPRSLQPVSLQLQWVTQAQFAGYYVAFDKGWYRDEGIDLTIKAGGPDLIASDLVAAGASDFGISALPDLSKAIQEGKLVVSIGQVQQGNGLLLIARKDSGITQPRDFIGKRVGVWLGSAEAQFDALMAQEGIAQGDLIVVSQGWSMDPFLKGELDVASAMIYNEYHVVLESGLTPADLNVIDYADFGLDFPGDALFTSRRMVQENPDLCLRMLRASLRGWQYAIDHQEETADIVLKYDESGVQTRDHQLSMMKEFSELVHAPGRPLGQSDRATVARMLETLLRYGILKGEMQPEDVYTSAFWEKARLD